MSGHAESASILSLTAQIVSAHLSNNRVETDALPDLIRSVHATLGGLSDAPAADGHDGHAHHVAVPKSEDLVPAVAPRHSVYPDYIICLEDGLRQKTMRRHLRVAHNLTPEQYRIKWNLPPEYPMVAPDYAEQRSMLAKKIGLGTKRSSGR